MGSGRAGAPRSRVLLAVEVVLVALVPAGVATAGAAATVTVTTQNLFDGANGLGDAFTASTPAALVAAGSRAERHPRGLRPPRDPAGSAARSRRPVHLRGDGDGRRPRVPAAGDGGGLVDVRLTDRDALIVRSDVARRVGDPRHGTTPCRRSIPFPSAPSGPGRRRCGAPTTSA